MVTHYYLGNERKRTGEQGCVLGEGGDRENADREMEQRKKKVGIEKEGVGETKR